MAQSILDRYGIKEVADLTIYKLKADGSFGDPILVLDSLKVSTLETTAESVYATGGKGNAKLVGWDFGKEITLNIEDALYSPKSLSMIFGDGTVRTGSDTIQKTISFRAGSEGAPKEWEDSLGNKHTISNPKIVDEAGEEAAAESLEEGKLYYATFEIAISDGHTIEITPNSFPGTYGFVGETFARSEVTGEDEYFSFVIPKGKITSESSLTLEAEGDPTVFSFNVEVMRATGKDGKPTMMQLKQYKLS